MQSAVAAGEMAAYVHTGFWQCMDTGREYQQLESDVGSRRSTLDGGLAVFADVFRGRRVFVTGHTGFKGAWLAAWLGRLGAEVTGLALPPETNPSLFDCLKLKHELHHLEGDVADGAVVDWAIKVRPAGHRFAPGRTSRWCGARTSSR